MKNVFLYAAVGSSLMLSIAALTLSLSGKAQDSVDLPDDVDITNMEATIYARGGIPILNPTIENTYPDTVDKFIVPQTRVPAVMHFLRPPHATNHDYFIEDRIATLKIEANGRWPTVVIKCLWTGKGPVAFTVDDKNYFYGNRWCSADGGLGLRRALMDAYLESVK